MELSRNEGVGNSRILKQNQMFKLGLRMSVGCQRRKCLPPGFLVFMGEALPIVTHFAIRKSPYHTVVMWCSQAAWILFH